MRTLTVKTLVATVSVELDCEGDEPLRSVRERASLALGLTSHRLLGVDEAATVSSLVADALVLLPAAVRREPKRKAVSSIVPPAPCDAQPLRWDDEELGAEDGTEDAGSGSCPRSLCCRLGNKLSVPELFEHLRATLGAKGQLVHSELLQARTARFASTSGLSPCVSAALGRLGAQQLYCHQAAALEHLAAGRSLVLCTSTASGKSICFQIPILAALQSCPTATALLLFPTKALAQDQLRPLRKLMAGELSPPETGIYDGDTGESERAELRLHGRIIISNPDMLSRTILPHHREWRRFLASLTHIVVDECHAYRGAFGTHTAMVLRRLRRCVEMYSAVEPQFVFCSATISNPLQHAARLSGLDVGRLALVDDDGSPRGEKTFGLWNPALLHPPVRKEPIKRIRQPRARPVSLTAPTDFPDVPLCEDDAAVRWAEQRREQQAARRLAHVASAAAAADAAQARRAERRASPIYETAALLACCVQHGLATLAFCPARRVAELVLSYAQEILQRSSPELAPLVASYRAGYSAEERRAIEARLQAGTLLGVASTNALELGIDIGALDVTLHIGVPPSYGSLVQQAGRAGRREQRSLSILVAFDSPLDQAVMASPAMFFRRTPEACCVDPVNARILAAHLACAAFERPLTEADGVFFGVAMAETVGRLFADGTLGHAAPDRPQLAGWAYIGACESPASKVNLRSYEAETWRAINSENGLVIDEVEASKAFFSLYLGAVLQNQGRSFLVNRMCVEERTAYAVPFRASYYTTSRTITRVTPAGGAASAALYGAREGGAFVAAATVRTQWQGYSKVQRRSGEVIDVVDQATLPDVEWQTVAVWVRVPERAACAALVEPQLSAGMHAAVHGLSLALPLLLCCDGADVAAECPPLGGAPRPLRLLLYDRVPGGCGIAAQAHCRMAELLQAAIHILRASGCAHTPTCRLRNHDLDATAGVALLTLALDALSATQSGRTLS